MSPLNVTQGIQPLLDMLAAVGGPLQVIVAVAAFARRSSLWSPQAEAWRGWRSAR